MSEERVRSEDSGVSGESVTEERGRGKGCYEGKRPGEGVEK